MISRKFDARSGNTFQAGYGSMKHFSTTTKHLHSNLIEWALFKVPQLFVILYGK